MRKTLSAVLVLACLLTAAVSAVDTKPDPASLTAAAAAKTRPEFSVRIMLTKAVNAEDQFAGILPARPPLFPTVGKVVCGEPFEVGVVFMGAKIRRGRIKLEGKIIMTDPAGKKTEIPLSAPIGKVSGDVSGVFLFPQRLVVIYEPDDPKGVHTFEVELTDAVAKKTVRSSASLEYVEKVDPDPGVKGFEKLAEYYRSPSPEYILPAFREFLANLPKQKEKEGKNFNPLPQLAFFYFLLQLNPQCIEPFTELFKTLNGEEKFLAAVVLNFASADSAKSLTQEQRNAIGQQLPSDPFRIGEAVLPWHLDVCWAEFFVRGTRAPVMKVVQALTLSLDSISIEDYKKLGKPTPENQRKLMNGLTAMAANWSLASIAKNNPLVVYYVEAALARGEVKDPAAAALAAKAVGLKIKLKD